MKRYAFVDVDNTLVNGNLGAMLARRIATRKATPPKLRNKLRYISYILKSVHIALLYPFSFLLPVYYYVQGGASDRYLDLVESWDEEDMRKEAAAVVSSAEIPPVSVSFLKLLLSKGYDVVLLSSSPAIVLELLVRRIGLPLRYVGLDDKHPFPFTAHNKARVILEEFSDGIPAIVAGNPRREPFWLATELKIVVRTPDDLEQWIRKIASSPGEDLQD
jgi:hypothetical protein